MSDYSLAELAALTGLPGRTIRYYIAEGLIPSPGKEGPSTRYPETTLARLRLICRLRDAHQPLAAIRARLDALSDGEIATLGNAPVEKPHPGSALDYVRSLLGGGAPPGAERVPLSRHDAGGRAAPAALRRMAIDVAPPAASPAPSAPTSLPRPGLSLGERSHWERVALTPDVELHVRRPLGRPANRMVERLLAFARQLQAEEET